MCNMRGPRQCILARSSRRGGELLSSAKDYYNAKKKRTARVQASERGSGPWRERQRSGSQQQSQYSAGPPVARTISRSRNKPLPLLPPPRTGKRARSWHVLCKVSSACALGTRLIEFWDFLQVVSWVIFAFRNHGLVASIRRIVSPCWSKNIYNTST